MTLLNWLYSGSASWVIKSRQAGSCISPSDAANSDRGDDVLISSVSSVNFLRMAVFNTKFCIFERNYSDKNISSQFSDNSKFRKRPLHTYDAASQWGVWCRALTDSTFYWNFSCKNALSGSIFYYSNTQGNVKIVEIAIVCNDWIDKAYKKLISHTIFISTRGETEGQNLTVLLVPRVGLQGRFSRCDCT